MLDCSLTIVYNMFQKRCLMKNITLLSALLLTLGSVSAQAQMTVRRAPHSTSPLEMLRRRWLVQWEKFRLRISRW